MEHFRGYVARAVGHTWL